MKIGFVVNRVNVMRDFYKLVEGSLARNHSVCLLQLDEVDAKYPNATQIDLPAAMVDHVVIKPFAWRNLSQVVIQQKIDWLLFLEGVLLVKHLRDVLLAGFEQMRLNNIKLMSVCHLHEVASNEVSAEYYTLFDVVCYPSSYTLDYQLGMQGETTADMPREILKRIKFTGAPILDQFAGLNKSDIKTKYAIPDKKKVVLLMSLKLAVGDKWRCLAFAENSRTRGLLKALLTFRFDLIKDVLWGIKYRRLVEQISRFCKRNDAILAIKSREKNSDPPYIKDQADIFCIRQDYFPDTSAELLTVADLCIHFQSATVLEAAMAGVPSISVEIPHEHIKKWRKVWHETWFRNLSVLDFPGVVYKMTVRELYDKLSCLCLKDFSVQSDQREKYVTQYLGYGDLKSSERMLDLMDSTLSN